jgi:hypothetical protein
MHNSVVKHSQAFTSTDRRLQRRPKSKTHEHPVGTTCGFWYIFRSLEPTAPTSYTGWKDTRGFEMKRLILIVVLMMTVGCSGTNDNTTPTKDTTEPDTTETDTTETDTTETDTTEPDTVVPPPLDVTLPPPDTATPDADPADTGPSGPAASCRVGLDCALECDDKECQDKCLEGMEMSLWENAGAVLVCQEDECSSNDLICMLDKCYSDFAACYFDGKTGENDCLDTRACVEKDDCDEDCVNGCLQSADAEAQQEYVNLYFCIVDYCANDAPISEEECLADKNPPSPCSTHWMQCYNI